MYVCMYEYIELNAADFTVRMCVYVCIHLCVRLVAHFSSFKHYVIGITYTMYACIRV